jgi:DNA repair protein RecO (recombination protein O)
MMSAPCAASAISIEMRAELQTGYVLHTRPYRDNSLLVEFLSRELGRISLVAKGAKGRKKSGGSTAALLQPFTQLSCSWVGRSELKTLTLCDALSPALQLSRTRLFSGLYLNELLVRLLHHEDPHQQLFDNYQWALQQLAGELAEELILRPFEFGLLEELGYGFDLSVDGLSGEPIADDRWYHYHQDYGLVPVAPQFEGRLPRYRGCDLRELARGDFQAALHCAKQLMRQVLAGHLGDKPLMSRELFRQPS